MSKSKIGGGSRTASGLGRQDASTARLGIVGGPVDPWHHTGHRGAVFLRSLDSFDPARQSMWRAPAGPRPCPRARRDRTRKPRCKNSHRLPEDGADRPWGDILCRRHASNYLRRHPVARVTIAGPASGKMNKAGAGVARIFTRSAVAVGYLAGGWPVSPKAAGRLRRPSRSASWLPTTAAGSNSKHAGRRQSVDAWADQVAAPPAARETAGRCVWRAAALTSRSCLFGPRIAGWWVMHRSGSHSRDGSAREKPAMMIIGVIEILASAAIVWQACDVGNRIGYRRI